MSLSPRSGLGSRALRRATASAAADAAWRAERRRRLDDVAREGKTCARWDESLAKGGAPSRRAEAREEEWLDRSASVPRPCRAARSEGRDQLRGHCGLPLQDQVRRVEDVQLQVGSQAA